MAAEAGTREQILNEARELFLRQGLNRFSMRTVAERVGVSATALYRHFDDKDALLASMLAEAFGSFGGYLGRSLAGRTPLERFRKCGQAYIDFALDRPREYELMFLTNCHDLGFKKLKSEVDERSQPTFQIVVDRVRECVAADVFAACDPNDAALYSWATLHGLVSLWLLGQLKESLDEPAFRDCAGRTLDRLELSLRSREAARRS